MTSLSLPPQLGKSGILPAAWTRDFSVRVIFKFCKCCSVVSLFAHSLGCALLRGDVGGFVSIGSSRGPDGSCAAAQVRRDYVRSKPDAAKHSLSRLRCPT